MEGATRTIGNNRSVRRNKDHCLHTTNSEDIRDKYLNFLVGRPTHRICVWEPL